MNKKINFILYFAMLSSAFVAKETFSFRGVNFSQSQNQNFMGRIDSNLADGERREFDRNLVGEQVEIGRHRLQQGIIEDDLKWILIIYGVLNSEVSQEQFEKLMGEGLARYEGRIPLLDQKINEFRAKKADKEKIAKEKLEIEKKGKNQEPQKDEETEVAKECPICLEEFKGDDEIAWLDCFHKFHKKCVNQWLIGGNGCCPACRSNARGYMASEGLVQVEQGQYERLLVEEKNRQIEQAEHGRFDQRGEEQNRMVQMPRRPVDLALGNELFEPMSPEQIRHYLHRELDEIDLDELIRQLENDDMQGDQNQEIPVQVQRANEERVVRQEEPRMERMENEMVQRDVSGNFSAGTIQADLFSGNSSQQSSISSNLASDRRPAQGAPRNFELFSDFFRPRNISRLRPVVTVLWPRMFIPNDRETGNIHRSLVTIVVESLALRGPFNIQGSGRDGVFLNGERIDHFLVGDSRDIELVTKGQNFVVTGNFARVTQA